jgi:hypothetical protein
VLYLDAVMAADHPLRAIKRQPIPCSENCRAGLTSFTKNLASAHLARATAQGPCIDGPLQHPQRPPLLPTARLQSALPLVSELRNERWRL